MADIQVPMPDWTAPLRQLQEQNSPVARGQADLFQQQATGAGIQNQTAALQLGLFKRALGDFSGQVPGVPAPDTDQTAPSPDTSGETDSDASAAPAAAGTASAPAAPAGLPTDAAGIQAGLRQRFFVNPRGTPQMQAQLRMAALSGNAGLLQYAKEQRDQYVGSQTAQNQNQANMLYDLMGAAANAPDGAALATLERVSPQAAAQIEAKAQKLNLDPEDAARHYAQMVAMNAHQYTGRKIIYDQAGVPRDSVTGEPVTGVPQAGLSPYALSKVISQAMSFTTTNVNGVSARMPTWKASGASSPAEFVLKTLGSMGLYSPGMPGANQVQAKVQQMASRAQPSGQPAITIPGDPVLTKALQDTTYRFQRPVVPPGQSLQPDQKEVLDNYAEQRKDLQDESQDATAASAQALTYLKAAKMILTNKNADVIAGPYAPLYAKVRQYLGGGAGPSNYIEAAKFLSNAALQNLRASYGGRPTQMEVKLNLQDLNPNADMPEKARNDLVDEMMRMAQYGVQTARRVPIYLRAGNDPGSFGVWNQKFYPQEKVVNKVSDTAAPAQNVKPLPPAAKLQAYAKTHFGGDTKAAVAFLRTKGYK